MVNRGLFLIPVGRLSLSATATTTGSAAAAAVASVLAASSSSATAATVLFCHSRHGGRRLSRTSSVRPPAHWALRAFSSRLNSVRRQKECRSSIFSAALATLPFAFSASYSRSSSAFSASAPTPYFGQKVGVMSACHLQLARCPPPPSRTRCHPCDGASSPDRPSTAGQGPTSGATPTSPPADRATRWAVRAAGHSPQPPPRSRLLTTTYSCRVVQLTYIADLYDRDSYPAV